MKEDKYFWFMIHRVFWKTHLKVNPVVIREDQPFDFDSDGFWLRNDVYNLKNEDKNTLMDAAQKRICRVLFIQIVAYKFLAV